MSHQARGLELHCSVSCGRLVDCAFWEPRWVSWPEVGAGGGGGEGDRETDQTGGECVLKVSDGEGLHFCKFRLCLEMASPDGEPHF